MNTQQKINDVHHFWFGDDYTTPAGVIARRQLWFMGSKDFDAEVTTLFSDDLQHAASGAYDSWEETPRGALALILIMDQFPRNIHRGTACAFEYDAHALSLCLRMLEAGCEQQLSFMEQMFVAMPLQHAEDAKVQQKSAEWFTRWAERAEPQFKQIAADTLQYAKLHWEIIERFGRFPHRNALLSRTSRDDELEYLESSGITFGQSASSSSSSSA